MGWREDREREEKVRELRRQQSELERDAAFTRGLTFSNKRPLELLPSFVTARIGNAPKPRAIGLLDRGVYRDPFSPEGWADFLLVDSRGRLRRKFGMPADEVTDDTVPRANRILDQIDPLIRVMA